jgi:hypothetical protein
MRLSVQILEEKTSHEWIFQCKIRYTVKFSVTKSCFVISNNFPVLESLFIYYFTVYQRYKLLLCYSQRVNRSLSMQFPRASASFRATISRRIWTVVSRVSDYRLKHRSWILGTSRNLLFNVRSRPVQPTWIQDFIYNWVIGSEHGTDHSQPTYVKVAPALN